MTDRVSHVSIFQTLSPSAAFFIISFVNLKTRAGGCDSKRCIEQCCGLNVKSPRWHDHSSEGRLVLERILCCFLCKRGGFAHISQKEQILKCVFPHERGSQQWYGNPKLLNGTHEWKPGSPETYFVTFTVVTFGELSGSLVMTKENRSEGANCWFWGSYSRCLESRFYVAISWEDFIYFFLEHDDEDAEFTLVFFFSLKSSNCVSEKYANHWPTRHTSDPHFPSSFEEEHWLPYWNQLGQSVSLSLTSLPKNIHWVS